MDWHRVGGRQLLMPDNSTHNQAEQAFVAQFAAKDEPAVQPPATVVDAPTDEAPVAVVASESAEPAAPTPDAPDAPADDVAPESDDEDEDDEEDAPDETPAAETPESDAAKALAEHGAKLTLDDVPEAARPFVQQRIREIEAGLTRARQKDTAALVELRAEQRFRAEHAADAIVAEIRTNPALADAVNALLDEFEGSPTAAKAHEVVVKDQRATARQAEETAARSAADADREIAALDAHLEAQLAAAGVKPGKALERLLAAAFDVAEAKTGTRRISTADIDGIVADYAADVDAERAHARKLGRRAERERQVRETASARREASPVRPGAGAPPAAGKPPMPKTDDEFVARFAASA